MTTESDTRRCTQCGKLLEPRASACPRCHHPVAAARPNPAPDTLDRQASSVRRPVQTSSAAAPEQVAVPAGVGSRVPASRTPPAPTVRPLTGNPRTAGGRVPASTAVAAPAASSLRGVASAAPAPPHADFVGTVIATDPPHEEPPDPNPGRTLFLILYALPLLALLPLVLTVFLVLFIPLRLAGIRGFNLWPMLTLLGMLGQRGGGGVRTVPVRNLRLRDVEGREQQVRIKGHLVGGVADRGDPVMVWGRRRDGVIHLHHGRNLRTDAHIRLRSTLPYGVIIPATIGWLAILWLSFLSLER